MTFLVGAAGNQGRIQYPDTRRVDQVDTYFGVKVADPYRWLETTFASRRKWPIGSTPRTRSPSATWSRSPERDHPPPADGAGNFPQYSPPLKEGGRYYYFKNDGLQNQAVLYVADSLDGQRGVLLDPNTWSKDGTIALAGLGFSRRRHATWPTPAPRPDPTGTPGGSWKSPPATCCPTS